jgi:hypothetical protein
MIHQLNICTSLARQPRMHLITNCYSRMTEYICIIFCTSITPPTTFAENETPSTLIRLTAISWFWLITTQILIIHSCMQESSGSSMSMLSIPEVQQLTIVLAKSTFYGCGGLRLTQVLAQGAGQTLDLTVYTFLQQPARMLLAS